jgi:TorA maturation chaperone TorD
MTAPATAPRPLAFSPPDTGEELARAEVYGLLARLYYAAPDADLLRQFGVAVTQAPVEGAFLEAPWQALVAAMRAATVQAAADEYAALFLGTGKAEVFLYGSHYLSGSLNDKPLAVLRGSLAALGLTRDPAMAETEDHVAYVLEVMRYLIAGDDLAVSNLEQQRRFYQAHLQPWIEPLCQAIMDHPAAALYRAVAAFTAAFVQVENQGFDLLE